MVSSPTSLHLLERWKYSDLSAASADDLKVTKSCISPKPVLGIDPATGSIGKNCYAFKNCGARVAQCAPNRVLIAFSAVSWGGGPKIECTRQHRQEKGDQNILSVPFNAIYRFEKEHVSNLSWKIRSA